MHKLTLFDNGYYKAKEKIDGSMKAHFRRQLMHFYNAKQNKTAKYYFDYDEYLKFVDNNVNDDFFADHNVVHCYFAYLVAKLVGSKFSDNIKIAQSSLKQLTDIESHKKNDNMFIDKH